MTPQFEAACIAALMICLQDPDDPFDTTDDAIRCYGRFRDSHFKVSGPEGAQFPLNPEQMEAFSEWWMSLDEEARHVVTLGTETTELHSDDSSYELNMRFERVSRMNDIILNALFAFANAEMGV